MKYAVKNARGIVMSVFDADDLAGAVEVKPDLQEAFNERHDADEVFSVAKATAQDVRTFKPAGFVVGRAR